MCSITGRKVGQEPSRRRRTCTTKVGARQKMRLRPIRSLHPPVCLWLAAFSIEDLEIILRKRIIGQTARDAISKAYVAKAFRRAGGDSAHALSFATRAVEGHSHFPLVTCALTRDSRFRQRILIFVMLHEVRRRCTRRTRSKSTPGLPLAKPLPLHDCTNAPFHNCKT